MHVKMRHALADNVIKRNEGALRATRLLDSSRQLLRPFEQRTHLRRGRVEQGFVMLARNEQSVAGEEWGLIQECEVSIILINDGGPRYAADDVTEDTGHRLTLRQLVR